MTSEKQLAWYVLCTRPRQEKHIYSELLKKNTTAFLPLQTVYRQWSDRKKKLLLPLIPNYLFIKTANLDYTIVKMPGVVKYLYHDGRPAKLTEREIDFISKCVNYPSVVCTNEEFCAIGERVKIDCGQFAGMEGVLENRRGQNRLLILLKSLGKTISLDIPAAWVKKI